MHRIIIAGPSQREHAIDLLRKVPINSRVTIAGPTRTVSQNARLWAMLSEISAAKPAGRFLTPEVWKALFMSALGHEQQFTEGLSGEPFPLGFRTSNMTIKQMIEMQDFIEHWCATNGVTLSNWSKDAAQGI